MAKQAPPKLPPSGKPNSIAVFQQYLKGELTAVADAKASRVRLGGKSIPSMTTEEWTTMSEAVFISTGGAQISLKVAARDGRVDFRHCIFDGPAEFLAWEFAASTDFSDAVFNSEVRFDASVFGNASVFRRVKFTGSTSFDRCIFGDLCSFQDAKFLSEANFCASRFGSSISYYETQFLGPSPSFSAAEFGPAADFSGATFRSGLYAPKVSFHSQARWNKASFGTQAEQSVANFTRADLGSHCEFEDAVFHSTGLMQAASLGSSSSLDGTRFLSKADFSSASIGSQTSMAKIEIPAGIDANGAQIAPGLALSVVAGVDGSVGQIDLTGARLEGLVQLNGVGDLSLQYASVGGTLIIRQDDNLKGHLDLRSIRFFFSGHLNLGDPETSQGLPSTEPRPFNFDKLRRVTWTGSVFFLGVPRLYLDWESWPPRPGSMGSGRHASDSDWYEEFEQLEKSTRAVGPPGGIEHIYRQARIVFESTGRFTDAGDVHLVEMLTKTDRLLIPSPAATDSAESGPTSASHRPASLIRLILRTALGLGPLALPDSIARIWRGGIIPITALLMIASTWCFMATKQAPTILLGALAVFMCLSAWRRTEALVLAHGLMPIVALFSVIYASRSLWQTLEGTRPIDLATLVIFSLVCLALIIPITICCFVKPGPGGTIRALIHIYQGMLSGWGERVGQPLTLGLVIALLIPFLDHGFQLPTYVELADFVHFAESARLVAVPWDLDNPTHALAGYQRDATRAISILIWVLVALAVRRASLRNGNA